jgi:GTP-binding protein HflX
VDVDVLVPYAHSAVVARVHRLGAVLHVEHTDVGTRVAARVPAALAAELTDFAVT